MYAFFQPAFMPCVECGASVGRADRESHMCDGERVLDYLVFQLRSGVAAFEADLEAWLSTPSGRFERWYAERDRRRASGAR
jgi:hypothetical protein